MTTESPTPVVETYTLLRWLRKMGRWATCPRCGDRFRDDGEPDRDQRCPRCRAELHAPAWELMEEIRP